MLGCRSVGIEMNKSSSEDKNLALDFRNSATSLQYLLVIKQRSSYSLYICNTPFFLRRALLLPLRRRSRRRASGV